jgi:hypothetical protein
VGFLTVFSRASQCREEVHEVVPYVRDTVLLHECIDGAESGHIGVVDPSAKNEQSSEVTAVLVRHYIVGIVASRSKDL